MHKITIEIEAANDFQVIGAITDFIEHFYCFRETILERGLQLNLERPDCYKLKCDLPEMKYPSEKPGTV